MGSTNLDKKLQFFLNAPLAEPHRLSESIVNTYLQKALVESGYETEVFSDANPSMHLVTIPIDEIGAFARQMRRDSKTAYRLFSHISRQLRRIPRGEETKNIIFFHGVATNFDLFAFKDNGYDLYCANSRYIFDVLQSLLFCPVSLSPLKFINSIGEGSLSKLAWTPLCVPALDYPDGYQNGGQSVPENIWAGFDEPGEYFGHFLRPGKADYFAHVAIIFLLNQLGGQMNPPLKFRQFIIEDDFEDFKKQISAMGLPVELQNSFVPLPKLSNAELFRLVRNCKFSICYDTVPESFGLYPLESILNQVPVYSNGVGNIRHLLPPNHGLTVIDTAEMYVGGIQRRILAYKETAKRIFNETLSRDQVRTACSRGSDYIKEHYSYPNFQKKFSAIMKLVDEPSAGSQVTDQNLILNLSPLVRSWDPQTGIAISDHKHSELSKAQASAVEEVRSRSVSEIGANTLQKLEKDLLPLFHLGFLSFYGPNEGVLRF
jgi:hypothetical protein